MDSVLRGVVTYAFIWLVFRVAGKRSLSESTTFDLVLLLIISETVQNALTDQDHSMTGAFLLVVTLIGTDIFLSFLASHVPVVDKVINGTPVILLENGKPIPDRMKKARVQEGDILESARTCHGLERLDQIKYAVLERGGTISIIPEAAKA
jgi:uncharacterized membrane protein YcaP (DUF421 family)